MTMFSFPPRLATMALTAALTACMQQPAPEGAAAEPARQPVLGTSSVAAPLTPGGKTGAPALETGAGSMEKTCQGTTFRIVPDTREGAAETMSTALELEHPGGSVLPIGKPVEMAGYTAVGLGCAVAASDNESYFVVQYGELPEGCSFCEWFYLYDAAGKQLNASDPPILVDESLPDGERQLPNNLDYKRVTEALDFPRPEIAYVKP